MRILFIIPYVPNLIRVRPYNLIRGLSARGHQISLLTLWTSEQERNSFTREQGGCDELHAYRLSRWRSLYNCLTALPTKQPLQAWYCWHPGLADEVAALARGSEVDGPFDVIHVEHLRGVKYALHLLARWENDRQLAEFHPPVVWDSVDSISLLFRQSSAQSKKRLYRWLAQFELKRTERFEKSLLDKFARILVTSEKDKEAFLSGSNTESFSSLLTVLPNGVDLEYFHPDRTVQRAEESIVVSGKMSYHANVTMVMHFFENIMPIVWSRRPQAKLWIVGKDPRSDILALRHHPNVTVTGTVDDIRPYIQQADVAVAPLVYGAGIQNKVLESMACGTPVVATPQAVSALQAVPDRDLLIAQEPNEFAFKVLNLLEDSQKRNIIGEAGRCYVERYHDWHKIAIQLEEVYDAVI